MGDDGGYSINDLPKVSKIVSSENISKSEAFDFMIRFLKSNDSSSSNSGLAEAMEASNELNDFGAFSDIYHCWEDLFHVTETLASKRNGVSLDSDPQQVALRNLRLGVTLKTNDFVSKHETRSAHGPNGTPPLQVNERISVVEKASIDESPKKRSKREKSDKKEKKRKRER